MRAAYALERVAHQELAPVESVLERDPDRRRVQEVRLLAVGDGRRTAETAQGVTAVVEHAHLRQERVGRIGCARLGLEEFRAVALAGEAGARVVDVECGGCGGGATRAACGAHDGLLSFADTSTAANAVITTNNFALTQFTGNATAGNAQLITNAGGTVDFSGTSGPLGGSPTAGSVTWLPSPSGR